MTGVSSPSIRIDLLTMFGSAFSRLRQNASVIIATGAAPSTSSSDVKLRPDDGVIPITSNKPDVTRAPRTRVGPLPGSTVKSRFVYAPIPLNDVASSRTTWNFVQDAEPRTVWFDFKYWALITPTRLGSLIGNGRRRIALTTVKIPTTAPMPSPSVPIATIANVGDCRSKRNP